MFHVIDDEQCLCEVATELLRLAGYQAISFSDPLEYITYVYSDEYISPVGIFTDVRMPGMDGYALIDKIREKFPEQNIVVMSGYDESNRAFGKKIHSFIAKPYTAQKLINIADAIVRCEKKNSLNTNMII